MGFFISELFSGKPHLNPKKGSDYYRASAFILEKQKLPLPECLDEDIKIIVSSCLNYDGDMRPSIYELMEKVGSLLDNAL
jgi:hypothetical protein